MRRVDKIQTIYYIKNPRFDLMGDKMNQIRGETVSQVRSWFENKLTMTMHGVTLSLSKGDPAN